MLDTSRRGRYVTAVMVTRRASSARVRALGLALAFPLVAACGDCGDEPGSDGTDLHAANDPEARARDNAAATSASGPARVHYDLARHLARAERREGRDRWVVDLGAPGGAQHTLGGWQTQLGASVLLEGHSAILLPGVIGKLILPRTGPGAFVVTLRVRAFADGRITAYLDDETVAHATVPPGEWSTVSVALPSDALRDSERFLQLRVPTTGSALGVRRAGLAIDWMRIGPPDMPHAEDDPAPLATMIQSDASDAALTIPPHTSLGWAFEVPPHARFRATVRGRGAIRVRLTKGTGPPEDVASLRERGDADHAEDANDRPVDVDLSRHVGDIVRLDLVADAETTFIAPAVVTLDAAQHVVAPRPPAPTNVLVYLVDTLRADKLRVYEPSSRVRTPGLDRWVESGTTLFSRGHAQENWTKPSVATLLSGLMPWEHTAQSDEAVVPASVELLSELLRAEGFRTGAFVANGYVSDKFGFDQGFGSFRNYIREGRRTQASFVAADVLAWLDAQPEDRPFFLYVHTIDPHVPYMPPDDVLATYDPDPYDGPVDFGRDRETLEKIKAGSLRVDERDKARLEALYDGEITYHDVHFASIMDGLARRGFADDTLVVFTADHGEEFFDHGSVGHGHSVFEELLHVPLVVRVPGLTDRASSIEDAASLVDVAPTILDALGKPIPGEMSGHSLLPLLRGESSTAPRATVSAFMNGWRAIVVGRYKLVQRTAQHVTLYDLESDPGEAHDLAPERPLAVRYLRGLLGLVLANEDDDTTRARIEHAPERTVIDSETEAQLRALGYVGTSRPQ